MKDWLKGGCHCGAVRFRVRSSLSGILNCNCSICTKKGYLHLIVPAADFQLEQGQDQQSCYRFNTGRAKHYFCNICGVSSYYIPRSHPNGVDVNARCLDNIDPASLTIEEFDGREWESNIHRIEGFNS